MKKYINLKKDVIEESFGTGLNCFINHATVKDFLLYENTNKKIDLSLSTDTRDTIERKAKEIFSQYLGKVFTLPIIKGAAKEAMKCAIQVLNSDTARPNSNILVKQLSYSLGRRAMNLTMDIVILEIMHHRKRTINRVLSGITIFVVSVIVFYAFFYVR